MASGKFYAIIAGVGAGTGRSVALKFSQTYPVILLSRNPENYTPIVEEIVAKGGTAHGFSADTSSPTALADTFQKIRTTIGEDAHLAAAIYNVGGRFVRKPFLDLSPADFTAGFEGNGLGLFNFAQQTIPLLLKTVDATPIHPPSLIITGATASLKGSAQCASFAAGKFAMRAVAQSLAREFGPQGVHVAHVVVDGVIDIPRTKAYEVNGGREDGKLRSESLAGDYWYLHTQHRSAWTLEMDVRPWVEKF